VTFDALMLMDYTDCVPDYYTPILITSQDMIAEHPDVVAAFVQATARGFAYAITNPAEAAQILVDAVPELDADLVVASAEWLADQYQSDAPRWGQQDLAIWQGYTDFLVENGILAEGIDAGAAFTNAFLPGSAD
jgi:ABC-type nitrate/sulfonate/bicarbonate transport system substrate-binding protein